MGCVIARQYVFGIVAAMSQKIRHTVSQAYADAWRSLPFLNFSLQTTIAKQSNARHHPIHNE